MVPGSGKLTVNGLDAASYFGRETLMIMIGAPLDATQAGDQYDFIATCRGGGKSGQAGALQHGISRALVEADNSLRPTLKRGGFLTRDSRMVERKKYGQPGARRKFQFSKR
ncbi:MAG: 30S ribosomal protein S9 [Candidatus Eisenbacteria bacterium]|uniref:30S ribosomal protein S9 n=1 Tax=Eiseniibacteriota bacterium TaxID=2212470 RepID=A0A7Y2ECL3_UNCEI|nr:30S ribosomal protein S9 [Candidatus Eisenbacteria bacterium]